ncbi:hypothetical protein U0070_008183 [Myodes glareolus]|uniref:Uncharacterized protein n=1 Tax=Myodes glareolus TaxID=447135 RepID=A0AAW0HM03_MYOGA
MSEFHTAAKQCPSTDCGPDFLDSGRFTLDRIYVLGAVNGEIIFIIYCLHTRECSLDTSQECFKGEKSSPY